MNGDVCFPMALIGAVRVSTDKRKTQRQHGSLDPICLKVIEERASGKPATRDRPDLLTARSYLREGDPLTVQEVDRLGRNLLEGPFRSFSDPSHIPESAVP